MFAWRSFAFQEFLFLNLEFSVGQNSTLAEVVKFDEFGIDVLGAVGLIFCLHIRSDLLCLFNDDIWSWHKRRSSNLGVIFVDDPELVFE